LGTFSKTLCPGLRVGYVVAPPALISQLSLVKQGMDLHSSTFSQLLTARLLERPDFYHQHLKHLRHFYASQYHILNSLLEKHLTGLAEWTTPTGGLFVWLKLKGIDTTELLTTAVKQGVAFMPGAPFFATTPKTNRLRLTFATATKKQMEKAISTLSRLLGKT
jgi:2-aminoadipate transaminase